MTLAASRANACPVGLALIGVLDGASGTPMGDTDGVCGGGRDTAGNAGSFRALALAGMGALGSTAEHGALSLALASFCIVGRDVKGLGVLACAFGTLAPLDALLLLASPTIGFLLAGAVAPDWVTAGLLGRLGLLFGELGCGLASILDVGALPPIGEAGLGVPLGALLLGALALLDVGLLGTLLLCALLLLDVGPAYALLLGTSAPLDVGLLGVLALGTPLPIGEVGLELIRLFGNCRDRQPVMHLFCGKIAWRMTAYVKNHGNSQ